MGNRTSSSSSSSYSLFCRTKPKDIKVLITGLDAAGKTTVLYRLKLPSQDGPVTTIPTIGFNVETIALHGYEFTGWDVGGRSKIRPLIKHYYKGMNALVFVVDSNDVNRLDEVRDELHRLLKEEELQGHPVLVYCNKQDLPNALSPSQLRNKLDIAALQRQRRILLVGCSATKGDGLEEGLFFLSRALETSDKVAPSEDDDTTVAETVDNDDTTQEQRGRRHRRVQLDYEPQKGNVTLERFAPIKKGTECPFAKAAKLWGGAFANHNSKTIEDQAKDHVPALADFTRRSNQGENLDGFCIELDDPRARECGPEELGELVRRMLTALADNDPAWNNFDPTTPTNMMRVKYIGSRGWRFRFDNTDFFVTTFAPCYPETSSRYAFGAEGGFLLLQPEQSFLRHNLPDDTPHTNWEHPTTIRDKTRVAFHKAGRGYYIPDTTNYPMAEHVVKPLKDDGVNVVHWWTAQNDDRTMAGATGLRA